jgi:hypothetical protein
MSAVSTSSNNIQNRKLAKTGENAGIKKTGDPVPTSAINADFQSCGPLYVTDTTRYYQINANNLFPYNYNIKIQPMTSDSTRYVLSKQSYQSIWTPDQKHLVEYEREDLDLGTKDLHAVEIILAGDSALSSADDTIEDVIMHPDRTVWNDYIRAAAFAVHRIWKYDTLITPVGIIDTSTIPEAERPYEFLECLYEKTGVKEPSNKANIIAKAQVGSKATRIFIGANSKIDPSKKMFDITGKAIRNASKVTPGLYIIQNK